MKFKISEKSYSVFIYSFDYVDKLTYILYT